MSKFWKKAGNFIKKKVKVKGAKIKDEDYNSAFNQLSETESGINSLRDVLRSFKNCTEPYCKLLKDLNASIKQIYKDTPFEPYTDNIIIKNEMILKDIDDMNKKITKLYSKTSEFGLIFEKAKESKKARQEKQKTFMHYEEKLKGISEDKKKQRDREHVKRNEEKYKNAVNEYIQASGESFEVIIDSLNLSWDFINPVLGELIKCQKDYFGDAFSRLFVFNDIIDNFKEIKEEKFDEKSLKDTYYDPIKFILHKSLIKKIKKGDFPKANTLPEKEKRGDLGLFIRDANTFGEVSENRLQRFIEIRDELSEKINS